MGKTLDNIRKVKYALEQYSIERGCGDIEEANKQIRNALYYIQEVEKTHDALDFAIVNLEQVYRSY